MIKTFKHIRQSALLISAMFLLLNNVYAQSVVFSSDNWPKRWERAMNKTSLNGFIAPVGQRDRYRSRQGGNDLQNVAQQQGGWGKQPEKMQHKHKRSRTPEYHNGSQRRYDEDPLKQRYAIPNTSANVYGYGIPSANPYYGTMAPVIPHIPAVAYPGAVYPGAIYGGYPGIYPGVPYSTPFNSMPGFYPGSGYPGAVYPGFGYPW